MSTQSQHWPNKDIDAIRIAVRLSALDLWELMEDSRRIIKEVGPSAYQSAVIRAVSDAIHRKTYEQIILYYDQLVREINLDLINFAIPTRPYARLADFCIRLRTFAAGTPTSCLTDVLYDLIHANVYHSMESLSIPQLQVVAPLLDPAARLELQSKLKNSHHGPRANAIIGPILQQIFLEIPYEENAAFAARAPQGFPSPLSPKWGLSHTVYHYKGSTYDICTTAQPTKNSTINAHGFNEVPTAYPPRFSLFEEYFHMRVIDSARQGQALDLQSDISHLKSVFPDFSPTSKDHTALFYHAALAAPSSSLESCYSFVDGKTFELLRQRAAKRPRECHLHAI